MGRFVLAFALLAAVGAAAPGRANTVVSPRATTVLILRPPNSPPAMVEMLVRLRGELSSAGFGSEIVEGPAAPSAGTPAGPDGTQAWNAAVEQLAARRGAAAVVAIIGDTVPDSVEIWVVDDGTGKALVRRVRLEPTAPRSAHTLAIRAIELLRSTLLEIELARAARDRQNAPRAPVPTTVPLTIRTSGADEEQRRSPHPERFAIELGGSALVSPNGVGPTVLPLGALRLVAALVAGRPSGAGRLRDPHHSGRRGWQRAHIARLRFAWWERAVARGLALATVRVAVLGGAAHGSARRGGRPQRGPGGQSMVLPRRGERRNRRAPVRSLVPVVGRDRAARPTLRGDPLRRRRDRNGSASQFGAHAHRGGLAVKRPLRWVGAVILCTMTAACSRAELDAIVGPASGDAGARDGGPGSCPSTPLPAGDTAQTIQVGGIERSYLLHVPATYDGRKPAPLLVDLHALAGWARRSGSFRPIPRWRIWTAR